MLFLIAFFGGGIFVSGVASPVATAAPEVSKTGLKIVLKADSEAVSNISITCGDHQEDKKIIEEAAQSPYVVFDEIPSSNKCEVSFKPQGAKFSEAMIGETYVCAVRNSTEAICGSDEETEKTASETRDALELLNETEVKKVVKGDKKEEVIVKKGKVKLGEISIAFDDENIPDISATVQKYIPEIDACYENSLKGNSNIRGEIVVDIEISQGRVMMAKLISNKTGSSGLGVCVQRAIRRWKFPPIHDFVAVSFVLGDE